MVPSLQDASWRVLSPRRLGMSHLWTAQLPGQDGLLEQEVQDREGYYSAMCSDAAGGGPAKA